MKKRGAIITAVLILVFLMINIKAYASADKINNKTIRVGTSGTYYPFTFLEENEVKGFEIDVWNEISKRLNYDVEFKTASFSGLFGMLDSDKIDVISNQITITDERKEKYYFSDPYVESGAQIVVKSGNSSTINSFEDLNGKNIGVDLGSNYEQILKDKNSKANIITYQSTDAAFNDLIIVTHEISFAKDIADLVVFMDKGVIVEKGTTDEILLHPKEIRTKEFLANVVLN